MLKHALASLLITLALAAPALAAADGNVAIGENGLAWHTETLPDGSAVLRMFQRVIPGDTLSEWENTGAAAIRAVTFQVGYQTAELERIEVWSTNCADCDVFVLEMSSGSGPRAIYVNDELVSQEVCSTVSGTTATCTTYTQYDNWTPRSPGVMAISGSVPTATYSVTVVVKKVDGSNDDDVGVALHWIIRG